MGRNWGPEGRFQRRRLAARVRWRAATGRLSRSKPLRRLIMRALYVVLPIAVLGLVGGAPAQEEQVANPRKMAGDLTQQLGARLRAELAQGGPGNAIAVCKDIAPQLAGRLARESGARVAPVSLKTRNALLGAPDAWEQRALAEMDRRAAA